MLCAISFWQGTWLNNSALCAKNLFDLCLNQDMSVQEVVNNEWSVQFKIILPSFLRDRCYEIASR
jgi:hypothetical protein